MESAHKPYDGFFRSVFARPRLAWELTRTVAPALASGFTARQVHVESVSPVDPEFAQHHTDLLIRLTRRKTDTFVLVLYEHKSVARSLRLSPAAALPERDLAEVAP